MDEQALWQTIGKLTMEKQTAEEFARVSGQLLGQLKSGEVKLEWVTVTDGGWSWQRPQVEATPAQGDRTLELLEEIQKDMEEPEKNSDNGSEPSGELADKEVGDAQQ